MFSNGQAIFSVERPPTVASLRRGPGWSFRIRADPLATLAIFHLLAAPGDRRPIGRLRGPLEGLAHHGRTSRTRPQPPRRYFDARLQRDPLPAAASSKDRAHPFTGAGELRLSPRTARNRGRQRLHSRERAHAGCGAIRNRKVDFRPAHLRVGGADVGSHPPRGEDIAAYDPQDVRRRIAYVPQEPFLFTGTIRDKPHLGRSANRRRRDRNRHSRSPRPTRWCRGCQWGSTRR